jgi:hypothetical protein
MDIFDPQAPHRIFAAIPSRTSIHFLTEHGQFPSSEWLPSDGTREGTFLRIGRRVLGTGLSIDRAHTTTHGTIYLAQPVDPATVQPNEAIDWSEFELETDRFEAVQGYLRQFVHGVVQALHQA